MIHAKSKALGAREGGNESKRLCKVSKLKLRPFVFISVGEASGCKYGTMLKTLSYVLFFWPQCFPEQHNATVIARRHPKQDQSSSIRLLFESTSSHGTESRQDTLIVDCQQTLSSLPPSNSSSWHGNLQRCRPVLLCF
jgi:hypothetical protein